MSSVSKKPLEHIAQVRILRGYMPAQPVDYLGILGRKQRFKGLLLGRRGMQEFPVEVAHQQHVQLAHAAAAAPAQAGKIPRFHRTQSCRSASIRFVAAIARAGFRSLGQA